MGVAIPIMMVAGAAVSAYGAVKQGEATAQSMAYKAQVAENNAQIARQNASLDIQSGEIAAVNQGLKTRSKVASERAQQGAAGIDTNSGSAADVRAGSAEMGMLDSLTIRSNAAKKAWSDEFSATSETAQAQLDRMAGANAESSGLISATGSLLSSVSTAGKSYAGWQNQFGSTSSGGGQAIGDPTVLGGLN